MFDLLIIGGGPAGTAAAVYAARKQLKSALITKEWGGQSVVSTDIQNWIGTPHLSGPDMAQAFKAHVEEYKGDIVEVFKKSVERIEKLDDDTFQASLTSGDTLHAKALLIATGSNRRRLPAPGADEFEHKGVTYCASCDGPMFQGQDVAVIGGGNAGFESAAQLLAYCKSVTLLEHSDEFKADPITVKQVSTDPKFTALKGAEVTEVYGQKMAQGMRYTHEGEEKDLPVTGIFVEIGMIPATSIVEGLVEMDDIKRITIDPWTQKTSQPGIWAAGDCTNVLYHQNNIAAGDAVRALEDIYVTLKTG